MKKISIERGKKLGADALLPRRAVKRVAYNGTAERGKMDANLMRAAGMQIGFDQDEPIEAQTRTPVGASFAAFAAAGSHSRTAAQIARNGQFDLARVSFDFSMKQRDVGFLHEAIAKILDELAMRVVVARDHNRAGSLLVESMHDPGPQWAADGRQSRDPAETMQQRGNHACRCSRQRRDGRSCPPVC